MNNECVGLDMPNGKAADVKYPQQFVRAPNPNKAGPTNHAAKRAPSLEEAMKGIDRE